MPDIGSSKFSLRTDDNLLALWRGRNRLPMSDFEPLQDELERRGLWKEAERIAGEAYDEDPYGDLPRGPQTYGNLTVPFWWLRELWLRHKTRNGVAVEAVIKMAQLTGAQYRSASRAELVYSYEFQGKQYSGRIVRDFMGGTAAAESLAYDHHPGEKLSVAVDQENPSISYCPSGFGSIEPIIIGVLALFACSLIIALIGDSWLTHGT
jgi:hypothetical protein